MRIAQIAPLVERVPPKAYGGTERVVHALTEELVRRGHDVTLFASGDSETSARLYSVYPRALREIKIPDLYGFNTYTLLNVGTAYDMQGEFDIIHDHLPPHSLPLGNMADTPVVVTMHGPFTHENKKLFNRFKKPHVVGISQNHITGIGDVNIAKMIYNGLPMTQYPFGREVGDYLVFVGRMSREKGVHHAIEVARELDMELVIAAKLDEVDRPYFSQYVEPHLSSRIRWVGEVNTNERNKLLSNARCFLHPVTWREPFGLAMVEAMACGCPVVGFARGSVGEIVLNGVSGFAVDGVDDMISAVENIGSIDRAACRDYALRMFNAERMTDEYEQLYAKIVANPEAAPHIPAASSARVR